MLECSNNIIIIINDRMEQFKNDPTLHNNLSCEWYRYSVIKNYKGECRTEWVNSSTMVEFVLSLLYTGSLKVLVHATLAGSYLSITLENHLHCEIN